MNKKIKCKAKDCKRKIELPYRYCSIECACYDGYYVRQKGQVIVNPEKIKELQNEKT